MKSLLAIVIASVLSLAASAQDKAPYTIEIKAKQVRGEQAANDPAPAGDVIQVETHITDSKDGTVLNAPRLTLFNGTTAQIAIGEQKAVKPEERPSADLSSGLKIDVTKPLDRAEVLVVTTILKDGKVTWADARWAKVEPLPKP